MPTLPVLSVVDLVEVLLDSAAAMEAHSPGIDDLAAALRHVSGNSEGTGAMESDAVTTSHLGVGADCARSIDVLKRLVERSRPTSCTEFASLLSGAGQSSNGRPTEGQPTEGRPTEGQPTEGRPTEGRPTEGQPGEGQPQPSGSSAHQADAGARLVAWWHGFAEACRNLDFIGPVQLGIALELAAEYASEVKPGSAHCVESTMQRAAAAALAEADKGGDLAATILAAADAGLDDMEGFAQADPQLSEAGVVDATTASWLVLLESFVSRICGEDETQPAYEFEDPDAEEERSEHLFHLRLEIAAPQAEIHTIERGWRALGDFIEVVAVDPDANVPQWRLSLCTDHVGPAIEMVLRAGRPHTVEVGLAAKVPHG